MSTRYSIAPRGTALNGIFASLSCALALTLTAGPALAAPGDLERVEISGRMVEAPLRYDVRASCNNIDTRLQDALQTAWMRERLPDQVRVQFVVDDGEVTAVSTRGASRFYERAVRNAVQDLQCRTAQSGPQIYRVRVDFIDPYALPRDSATRTASAQAAYRVALVTD